MPLSLCLYVYVTYVMPISIEHVVIEDENSHGEMSRPVAHCSLPVQLEISSSDPIAV